MSSEPCHNDKTTTYTGDEESPLSFGYSSKGEIGNTFLTGKNGSLYYVSVINGKNNSITHRWTQVKNKKLPDKSNDMLYQNITEDIENETYFSEDCLQKISQRKKKYDYEYDDEKNKWFYFDSKNPSSKKEIELDNMPKDVAFLENVPYDFYSYFYENLPEELYTYAFIPKSIKKDTTYTETGMENKIGGKVPFFTENEEWPITNNGTPMTFVTQFSDPRKNDPNMIYRIFIDMNDSGEEEYKIDYVDKTKNQKRIEPPEDSILENLFLISSWIKIKELTHFEKIMKHMNIPSMRFASVIKKKYDYFNIKTSHKMFDTYYQDSCLTGQGHGFKVGGTPTFCQYNTIEQYEEYEKTHLLEITESELIPYGWGDCGIAHFFEKTDKNKETDPKEYYLYWDCY